MISWVKEKERLILRLMLVAILIFIAGFLFYEQCTPVYPVIARVWAFFSRLTAAIWGGLEWPHAAILIFLLLLANFKEELRGFIQRVDEVGMQGLRARPLVPPAMTGEDQIAEANPSPVPSLPPDDGAARPVEAADTPPEDLPPPGGIPLPPIYFPEQFEVTKGWIRTELRGVDDPVAYLVNHLAFSRIWTDFESLYTQIFGGQIRLLEMLRAEYPLGMPPSVSDELWSAHQEEAHPALDRWTKEQYAQLLVTRGLMSAQAGTYFITMKGREFLVWITAVGRSREKLW